jgi:hypothetical protein
MRGQLRELSTAEDYYNNEMQTYTSDLSKLQLQKRTGDLVVRRVVAAAFDYTRPLGERDLVCDQP